MTITLRLTDFLESNNVPYEIELQRIICVSPRPKYVTSQSRLKIICNNL